MVWSRNRRDKVQPWLRVRRGGNRVGVNPNAASVFGNGIQSEATGKSMTLLRQDKYGMWNTGDSDREAN